MFFSHSESACTLWSWGLVSTSHLPSAQVIFKTAGAEKLTNKSYHCEPKGNKKGN